MQQQDEQMQQGQSGKIKCCVLGVGGKGAPAHAAKSVVRSLAELPDFYVRCAVAPSQLSEPHVQGIDALPNCEIYRCDYSADELADCLRECDLVFACTDHFDPAIHGQETVVGKSIVTVAKQLGVKHLIWLGAPNPEFESGGKWKVPMFQDKSVVADYIQEQGLPATVLVSSVPYQHFSDPNGAFIPRLESDKLVITMPLGADKYLTGFDMEDVGGVVKNIFKQCKDGQWKSSGVQFIPMVGDHKPLRDWISDIQHATGHRVQLNSPSIEEFEKLEVPHAFDWAQLCGWIADHECLGKTEKDMFDYCKQLAPLKSFSEWASEGLAMFASGGSGARMVV